MKINELDHLSSIVKFVCSKWELAELLLNQVELVRITITDESLSFVAE